MNPAQSNRRRIFTLARNIVNACDRVRCLDLELHQHEGLSLSLSPQGKRARTLVAKRAMNDARELYLRVSGLWAKGIRK